MSDQFNLLMNEIDRFKQKEIPKLIGKIKKQSRKLLNLKSIVNKLPKSEKFSDKWHVIAVDGGSDFTSLEGVGFAIATARSFTISFKDRTIEDKNLIKLFNTPSALSSSIVATTRMKSLEYEVANEALSEIQDDNVLILLDGSMTFPDSSLKDTNIAELTEAFNFYENNANSFFNSVEKNRNINIFAVSKDARYAKYLRGLLQSESILNDKSINQELKNTISELIDKEAWRERIALQSVMRKTSKENPCFTEPVLVSRKGIMKGIIPIKKLMEKGVLGTYYLYPNAQHSNYIEIPSWNLENLPALFELYNFLCRISPVLGYPYPLVYVDQLTRVTKKVSSKLFSQLIYEVRNFAPDIAIDLIASKMREKLH